MQSEAARARATDGERQLRLVRPADVEARTQQPQRKSVQRVPALAVWRLARRSHTNPLPRELARRAISHYTDPGDLVLAPRGRRGELLEEAARLGRRALPLQPTAAHAGARTAKGTGVAGTVVVLRSDPGADLVLAPIGTGARGRRLAALLSLLRPGGFLVLAAAPRADASRGDGLGSIVRAAQQSGLQYWQHIVALTPTVADGREPEARSQPAAHERGRAMRCHHDLLVFRRPPHLKTALAAAAAVEGVAA